MSAGPSTSRLAQLVDASKDAEKQWTALETALAPGTGGELERRSAALDALRVLHAAAPRLGALTPRQAHLLAGALEALLDAGPTAVSAGWPAALALLSRYAESARAYSAPHALAGSPTSSGGPSAGPASPPSSALGLAADTVLAALRGGDVPPQLFGVVFAFLGAAAGAGRVQAPPALRP